MMLDLNGELELEGILPWPPQPEQGNNSDLLKSF